MTHAELIAKLEAAIVAVEADLSQGIDANQSPYVMRDMTGRYILLDALAAVAQLKAAAEQVRG